jgi:cytoskeletal protein RodZ
MNARKKAAVAIIAGLATATSVAGAAGSATAAEKSARPDTVSTKTVAAKGPVTKGTSVKAPQVKRIAASKGATAERTASSVHAAAATTPCYVYTDATGDLCSWYFRGWSGSRGGVHYSDYNLVDNYFPTAGSGAGATMTNNAESIYNYDYIYKKRLFTGYGYTGAYGDQPTRSGGDYTTTYINNVESLYSV